MGKFSSISHPVSLKTPPVGGLHFSDKLFLGSLLTWPPGVLTEAGVHDWVPVTGMKCIVHEHTNRARMTHRILPPVEMQSPPYFPFMGTSFQISALHKVKHSGLLRRILYLKIPHVNNDLSSGLASSV